jgi:alpha-tubulin suppressor-like RCC1 family protein
MPRVKRMWVGFLVMGAVACVSAPAAVGAVHAALSWGGNGHGQLGNGKSGENTGTPQQISGLSGVAAVSAGTYHSLALLRNGAVDAWGDNEFGQLGDGTIESRATPVAVSGLSAVTAISAGVFFDDALLSSGTVMSWGLNDEGQLGDGKSSGPEQCASFQSCSKVPAAVSSLTEVTAVSAGFNHSLALLKNGTVMAWGNNLYGELGDGTTERRTTPVAVSGLSEVVAVSAGSEFSLALLKNGSVEAWGTGGLGQLGDGKEEGSKLPVAVSGLSGVTAISAGSRQSLALLSNGTVMAWGANEFGTLGDGKTEKSDVPVEVSGLSGVTAIAEGGRHSLALKSDGTVEAWGSAEFDQLGTATTMNSDVPVAVNGVSGVTGFAAGGYHSLTFSAPTPPEFGRCLKLAKGVKGLYATAACTTAATAEKFGFEWVQGPGATARYTTKFKELTAVALETVTKKRIACTGQTGKGEYTGLKSVGHVTLTLTGCEFSGQKCATSGFAAGELVTNALEGEPGWENKPKKKVALDLFAETSGQPVLAFTCGAVPVTIRGSLLVKLGAGKMSTTETLKYAGTAGKQKPEKFEGGLKDVLESSFSEGPVEQAALTLTTVRTAEEKIETNWFV